MITHINIENLKCNGCGNTITKTLQNIVGVEQVSIDYETSEITVEHTEGVMRQKLTEALRKIGYPETGTVGGLTALTTAAKSYVSCAIGRMSD